MGNKLFFGTFFCIFEGCYHNLCKSTVLYSKQLNFFHSFFTHNNFYTREYLCRPHIVILRYPVLKSIFQLKLSYCSVGQMELYLYWRLYFYWHMWIWLFFFFFNIIMQYSEILVWCNLKVFHRDCSKIVFLSSICSVNYFMIVRYWSQFWTNFH